MLDLVIVDDHPAVRSGLRGLLDDEDGLRVVATAATAREGFEAIADLRPAVALVDLHLPDDDGLSLTLRTRALPEPPRVVIYSAFADAALGVRAAIAGAYAVLAKSASPRALTSVLRGELRPALDPRALRAVGERLEPSDLAILGMLAHGVSEEELASTLGLSLQSALTRRQQMLARLSGRRPLAAA
ncbi:response regulator transcription factor [Solirubrobacter phytolaccae]|uniref:Response regulator transcription factor n=1 Tax=Solirubrobacter phytolaccae TaxID=1404360 RepID=A0A9X3N7G9_9ACTN|nr:response regulator transcription factor [Solirubrobacter phytolaccae]MDA0179126.1 response regulator transcription factor [Solirubrobacter phytolaccae]